MDNTNALQVPPGLRRGGCGFTFFGEYFDLIKRVQALCTKADITEEELFSETQKFSALYNRYKDYAPQETGVTANYLRSLCVAGCDLIDEAMQQLSERQLQKEDEGVER